MAERVLSESSRDNLSVVAAGCAFYALFAIFPALSALISLYGLAADPANIEQSFGMLGYVLPEQAYDIVIEQIRRVAQASGQTLALQRANPKLKKRLHPTPIRWPRRCSPLSISPMRSPSGAVFFNST